MTYEELEDFIVNTLNLQPEDFDSYDAYLEAIALEFKQNYNYGVENVTSDIWNTRIDEAEIYEKERRFQEEEIEEAEIQIDEAEERIRQGMTAYAGQVARKRLIDGVCWYKIKTLVRNLNNCVIIKIYAR